MKQETDKKKLPVDGIGGSSGGETGSGAPDPLPTSDTASDVSRLASRIAELEGRLQEAQQELEASAMDRRIDALLGSAGVIDLDVGRVLVMSALEADAALGVEEAVASLKAGKGFLFNQVSDGYASGAAYAPGPSGKGGEEQVELMREAASSGDRGELLRYMRARRSS